MTAWKPPAAIRRPIHVSLPTRDKTGGFRGGVESEQRAQREQRAQGAAGCANRRAKSKEQSADRRERVARPQGLNLLDYMASCSA